MKKLIPFSFLLWILAACSNSVQPTPAATPTLDVLPSATSAETLPVLPFATPTFQAEATAMPDSGDILDPKGSPAQEWRGIPIMPDAVAGQEFSNDNAYSFRVNRTATEVQDFYTETLTDLGWSQPLDSSFDESGGTITFRKVGSSLSITVTASGDSVVVLLVMALA